MKMKNKIISIGLALVLMISAFSTLTPLIASAAEVISDNYELEMSLQKSEECVEFIETNFSQVINEYNIYHQDEGIICEATFIEGKTPIYMTDENKYGFYLDFNDDNGYLLITEGYTLYEFEPIGDLSYLKEVESAYYSSFDGFMYLSDAGSLERYDYVDRTNEYCGTTDSSFNSVADDLTGAAGQLGTDDGCIYNIDAYVAEVYPKYEYVTRYMITDYEWVYQWDHSVYESDDGSEGNCVINATYSMMNDWIRRGRFSWLPTGTIDYSTVVNNDPLFGRYGNRTTGTWRVNSNTNTLRNLPELYMELRAYAIEYGYLPDQGMQSSRIIDMVARVASSRGYTMNMKKTSSFDSNVKYQLNTNKACVISVDGSTSYPSHAMGLYGYVEYEYTSGWWIFKTTKTKYFYVVDDGYTYKRNSANVDLFKYNFLGVETPVCYFDPNTSADPSLTFFYLED